LIGLLVFFSRKIINIDILFNVPDYVLTLFCYLTIACENYSCN